ncbi:conserved hypothetical protein [Histoplasma capsulatum H143]|uniref:Uncharacterized protein n=1 Tax=Ajellomyces capsulatus (strain H143) TaxID=544712 RepID=C6H503_AJECH|nr:conserved hypothetical protein [Histoplasma capsulatum H143]
MLINEKTALSSSRVLLVPYCKHHVPQYHEWMKDPEIQQATASEPLSLEEEYAMQTSWRTDADKLTFIICLPLRQTLQSSSSSSSSSPSSLPAGAVARVAAAAAAEDVNASQPAEVRATAPLTDPRIDASTSMLGDVNLFLRLDSNDEEGGNGHLPAAAAAAAGTSARVVGEIELMIAEKVKQGKGYGRAGLVCFLKYIADHEVEIMRGFVSSLSSAAGGAAANDNGRRDETKLGKVVVGEGKLAYLSAKIGAGNARSLGLFLSLGFTKVSDEPNVFGEVELRRGGLGGDEGGQLLRRCGVEEYMEVGYERG